MYVFVFVCIQNAFMYKYMSFKKSKSVSSMEN